MYEIKETNKNFFK